MSKILASIADAETYGRRQREYGFDETATRVEQTATAARAEHAEILGVLQEIIKGAPTEDPGYYDGDNHGDSMRSGWERCEWAHAQAIRALLSRVGGGA